MTQNKYKLQSKSQPQIQKQTLKSKFEKQLIEIDITINGNKISKQKILYDEYLDLLLDAGCTNKTLLSILTGTKTEICETCNTPNLTEYDLNNMYCDKCKIVYSNK